MGALRVAAALMSIGFAVMLSLKLNQGRDLSWPVVTMPLWGPVLILATAIIGSALGALANGAFLGLRDRLRGGDHG